MTSASQLEELGGRLAEGDRRALIRVVNAVEAGQAWGLELARTCRRRRPGAAAVLGFTGPPGAGKSTLVGRVATSWVSAGRRVGVLLVDPSSPISGGAVLGDRVRIKRDGPQDELYIRSVAARGQPGGLSATTRALVRVLDAWGADVVIIETVGAGQGEVDICRLAQRTVVICPPGLGDEMQAMKAGLMEIADVFVVNKADRPGAEQTLASLHDTGTGGVMRQFRPVFKTVATTGEGVAELLEELDRQMAQEPPAPAPDTSEDHRRSRLLVADHAARLVFDRIVDSSAGDLHDIVEAVAAGGLDPEAAAEQAAQAVVGP